MAYRGDDTRDALVAPTADGELRIELGPRLVALTVGDRTLQIAGRFATMIEGRKRESIALDGRVVVARDVPREDLGIWMEVPTGMRRIFGVEPVPLLDPAGLPALQRLDALTHRVRAALAELSGDIRRAIEIGRGLDKVLLVDHGDHHTIYARRLFRDHARVVLEIYTGKIAIVDGKATREVEIASKFGVTVHGDNVRFADRHGTDLAKISIPWLAPADRDELARRIGQLLHRDT